MDTKVRLRSAGRRNNDVASANVDRSPSPSVSSAMLIFRTSRITSCKLISASPPDVRRHLFTVPLGTRLLLAELLKDLLPLLLPDLIEFVLLDWIQQWSDPFVCLASNPEHLGDFLISREGGIYLNRLRFWSFFNQNWRDLSFLRCR